MQGVGKFRFKTGPRLEIVQVKKKRGFYCKVSLVPHVVDLTWKGSVLKELSMELSRPQGVSMRACLCVCARTHRKPLVYKHILLQTA